MFRKTIFGLAAVLSVCSVSFNVSAAPNYVAYSVYGPNTSTTASSADGAGYYIFDANELPSFRQFTEPNYIGHEAIFSSMKGNMSGTRVSDGSGGNSWTNVKSGSPSVKWTHYHHVENGSIVSNEGFGFSGFGIEFHRGAVVEANTTFGQAVGQTSLRGVGYSPNPDIAIQNVSPSQFTAQDIFTNGKSWLNVSVAGPTITATFKPHVTIGPTDFPVSLDTMAKLFGVDHFNWKQNVVIPSTWKAELKNANTITPLVPHEPYILDPISVEDYTYYLTNNVNGKTVDIENDDNNDNLPDFDVRLPWYFNEYPTGHSSWDVTNPAWTKFDQLVFQDSPSLPTDFDPQYLDMEFVTALVGIIKHPDGTYEEKPTPISFKWKSNVRYSGSMGYLGNLSPGNLGTVVGGVHDVEVFGVPEPSSLFLCLAGIVATQLRRKRRRS